VYLQQVLLSTEKDIEILNIQTGHCALWPWPFEFMTCSYLEINKHCNEPTNFYLVCIFFKKKLSNTMHVDVHVRFPFLLVDRVIEYKAGEYAVGIKNVTINDNFFPGHFPERPIMPGVLMVEAMAQVGGLVMLQPEVGGSRDNFFFAGIDKVRFRKPVIAGDTLIMRMTLTKYQKRFGLAKMDGKAYVGGDLVCEGEFLLVSATE